MTSVRTLSPVMYIMKLIFGILCIYTPYILFKIKDYLFLYIRDFPYTGTKYVYLVKQANIQKPTMKMANLIMNTPKENNFVFIN